MDRINAGLNRKAGLATMTEKAIALGNTAIAQRDRLVTVIKSAIKIAELSGDGLTLTSAMIREMRLAVAKPARSTARGGAR